MRNAIRRFKKGMAGNMVLNIAAGAVSVVALQLIILPYLGQVMDASEYGLLVTLLALLNVIPTTLGNSLNNIRLLYRNEYEMAHLDGDFSILFISEAVISSVSVIGFSISYFIKAGELTDMAIHLILLGILAIMWMAREYLIVAFLLKLDYKKILINNFLLAAGYFVGLLIYLIVGYWEVIYVAGYFISLFYIARNTSIWKERLVCTRLFPVVAKENIIYIIASLLYRITSYADKMLLYPLIGGAELSIYYVATLSSKVIMLIITPISGVMLSYLSKVKNTDVKKSFKLVYFVGVVVCAFGYFICLILSYPVLSVLYPQYVADAMKYIPITTATIVLSVLISLINPFVLRYLKMKWQVVINFVTALVYVSVGLILLKTNGLLGFCCGGMIANIVKLLIMTGIYLFAKKREE